MIYAYQLSLDFNILLNYAKEFKWILIVPFVFSCFFSFTHFGRMKVVALSSFLKMLVPIPTKSQRVLWICLKLGNQQEI